MPVSDTLSAADMLPTPRCFTSLCVLSHCSHSCLPPCLRLHFSTPSYIPWLQLAFLNTLPLSVPFSPHLTPYPCFPFLVLVLQLDCVSVRARVRAQRCVCACATIAQLGWARLWSGGGWGVQGFHFLLEQNIPVGPAGINWKCNLGLWADTQVGLEVWRREPGNKGPFLCAGTLEWMLPPSSGEPEPPPGALLQTWTPWGENWSQRGRPWGGQGVG